MNISEKRDSISDKIFSTQNFSIFCFRQTSFYATFFSQKFTSTKMNISEKRDSISDKISTQNFSIFCFWQTSFYATFFSQKFTSIKMNISEKRDSISDKISAQNFSIFSFRQTSFYVTFFSHFSAEFFRPQLTHNVTRLVFRWRFEHQANTNINNRHFEFRTSQSRKRYASVADEKTRQKNGWKT